MTQHRISPGEAVRYILDPRHEREFRVMGYRVTDDCPEEHELDKHGAIVCDHYDGVTIDEVDACWNRDSDDPLDIDMLSFAEYGPFYLDFEVEPGAPRADHDADRAVNYLTDMASRLDYVNLFWVKHSATVIREALA